MATDRTYAHTVRREISLARRAFERASRLSRRRSSAPRDARVRTRRMGIKGLPAVLEPYCERVHVGEYAPGTRCAVDAYSWLHKGAFGCVDALAPGGDRAWERRPGAMAPYVKYAVHRANMLRHHGIEPVIVFDGDRAPAKRGEERARRERRAALLERGERARAAGDKEGAFRAFSGAIDVTPEMARELIVALKREKFEFVVAPYEADATIASLALTAKERGGVDLVFTEDSDLVAYGCPRVVFKLEKSGDAKELRLASLFEGAARATTTTTTETPSDENVDDNAIGRANKPKSKGPPPLDFTGWDYELFLSLCVLSGCDFLDNIRGLGIKKMYNILNKHRCVDAVFAELRANEKIKDLIAEGYEVEWRKARMIFKHALVWDPHAGALRHLTPVPEHCEFANDLSFLGPKFDDDEARRIAEGELNPITRQKFKIESPRRAAKKTTLKIGDRRGKAAQGTSAQRSFMMNFLTKVVSPKKKPVFEAPTFEDDELDDDALAAVNVDAVPISNAVENAVDSRDVLTIDLIDDDDVALKPIDADAAKTDVFARTTPPRRKNFLSSMFSPGRAKKARPSP